MSERRSERNTPPRNGLHFAPPETLPRQNPQYRGVTTYLDIVPNERIISTELVETNDRKLLATQSTTTLERREAGTQITVTIQLTSFAGDDMINGARNGTGASLDNLVNALG